MSMKEPQYLVRHLRLAAIGWAVVYAVISVGLVCALYVRDHQMTKLMALFLIGWTPMGLLMTYGEAKEMWNGSESLFGYIGPVAIIALLAIASAVIG